MKGNNKHVKLYVSDIYQISMLKYHLLAWNAVDVVAENMLSRICCDPNWSTELHISGLDLRGK